MSATLRAMDFYLGLIALGIFVAILNKLFPDEKPRGD